MLPHKALRVFLAAILATSSSARADVVINEVMTAGSERLLQWSAAGVPQFGFGTPWTATAFDDSSWQTGLGPFGFGSFTNASPAPIATNTATQMQNLTPTLYLRKTFTADAAQAARTDALMLDVQFNDGFVCFINGVEVARRNAGPPNQFVYRDQFAAFGTPGHNEASTTPYVRTETLALPAANTLLTAGTNVIAIHALNYWEGTTLVTSTNGTVAVDNRNNFYLKADLRIGSDAPIVANNSAWRYFPGVAEPSGGLYDPTLLFSAKQRVPWGATAFDDTDWSSGAAPFGAGTAPSGQSYGTNLSAQVLGQSSSVYFRIVFGVTAADLADGNALQLIMGYDDGFVAYLNGVEVARQNLAEANAFTPHNAVTTTSGVNTGQTYTIDPPAVLLNEGQNVLAVQVHNVDVKSTNQSSNSDLFFRARLQRNGAARILVDYGNTWKYLIGTGEPVQQIGEAEEENPEAPDTQLDWVELHNNGTTAVPLGGWTLSDNPAEPDKWTFPAGTTIAPGEFLLIACDGADITAPASGGYFHTNFKLSADGETVGLYNAAGQLVQELAIPPLTAFESYGVSGGQYRLLATPTPRAANTTAVLEGIVAAPVFDPPNGIITGAITQNVTLTTSTPGATIRYTTDGTEPTETTGTPYGGTIGLSQNSSNGPGTVIRARAFKNGWVPSATKTATFLLNQSSARRAVPALCISGDQQRSLYRPFGIMAISGGTFSTHSVNNSMWTQQPVSNAVGTPDLGAYNNPIHRGRFIERPAVMELIYPSGAPGVSIEFGMRISGSTHARPRYVLSNQNRDPNATAPNRPNDGSWSATSTQKPSFNFFFRGDLGGDPLEFKLFPESPVTKFHDIRVRAGKNDPSNPFIEDEFMRRLFKDTGQVGSTGMITTLYINGVYKGYYNPCEHLREEFFQQHHGSELPWDVRQVSVIASGDGLAFQEMITFVRTNPQSVLANYQSMKTRLDMVNFIDYLIVNLFGVTGDWPHNNYVCARERSASGLHRYYMWDAEGAFGDFSGNVRTNQFVSSSTGSFTTSTGTTSPTEGIRILYTHLRNSPEFKLLFADRLQKHFFNGGVLTEAKILAKWNAMKTEFGALISPTTVTDNVTNWTNGRGIITRYTTSGATNVPSRRQVLFGSSEVPGYYDDTQNDPVTGVPPRFIPAHLPAEGLWPATLAPQLSSNGGNVAPGFQLTITNPNAAGAIYYTIDGGDPRAEGTGSAAGIAYNGALTINFPTTVRARVLGTGNVWSPVVEATFNTGTAAPILITEIMYDPKGQGAISGSEFEFLELKNTGAQIVYLHGARFTNGVNFTFPAGAQLAPGAFAVLAKNAAQFAARYPTVPLAGTFAAGTGLSKSGETLTLVDVAGNTMASVTYSDDPPWPAAAGGAGHSLVPVNPTSNPAPNDPANWRASTSLAGSPGGDDPAPTIRINEVLSNPLSGGKDTIELYNPTGADMNIGGWYLSDSVTTWQKYQIPTNTTITAEGYLVFTEDHFNPTPGSGTSFALGANGDDVVLSASDYATNPAGYRHYVAFGASDPGVSFGRHVLSTGVERFPAQVQTSFGSANAGPRIGPVVVTELMYLPAAGGDDFIELRNISNAAVPLFDPANPANTWSVAGVGFSFPQGVTLAPGDIVLLTALNPASFRTKYGIPAAVEIYQYPGNLSDNGEQVGVRKPTGQPPNDIDVDLLTFTAVAPWPNAAGNGKSLERVNVFGFADDPQSWQASAAGGSPAQPVPLTLTSWLSQFFTPAQQANPAIGGRMADPDGDGIDNMREWAHGLDPWTRDGQDAVATGIETHNGQPYLTLRYRRNLGATGAGFFADTAGALGVWNLDAAATVGSPISNGDGTETVTRRDTFPATGSGAPSRFIRLRVTVP